MAYDEKLAARVRDVLSAHDGFGEIRMFGGLCFTVHGHICCGVAGDELMVRVGAEAYADAVGRPHARAMDFTGKPLRGFVYVGPAGFATKRALAAWVRRGVDYVSSLPTKTRTRRPRRAAPRKAAAR